MNALEAVNLHKNFGGTPIIQGMSLALHDHEIVGLLGPNGAGKTTTLLMLVGALQPDRGEVNLFGDRFLNANFEQRRLIGFAPQELAVYPGLNVVENLTFFGGFYEPDRRLLARQVAEVIEICDLSARRRQRAGTLSSGLKRRLNLAIALVHRPPVLILDEATVGMDFESRQGVLKHLRAIADEGTSILFATHLIEEAEQLCDRILVLNDGRLVDEKSPNSGPPLGGSEGRFSRAMEN